jgi:hypothetical protein
MQDMIFYCLSKKYRKDIKLIYKYLLRFLEVRFFYRFPEHGIFTAKKPYI